MSILGSLIIELKASTVSFTEGMNAASKTARTVGREIESSFSALGSVAETALAPFGALGAAIAGTLGQVGASAGSAIQAFGKMGGVLGGVAAIGGGAAAAVGAVSLGAIALATHTAESIAKMGELSQSTGVSVEALSALSFVFKATGVEAETGVKGIEKLDKAILKAATSPIGTANAFTRLGISVRDSGGNIKNADVVFTELAGKFAGMQDSAVKTGLAMELFGKGGAALIPALNKGKAGIQDMIDTAKALGLVLDDQTVQAAEKFKESLATIEAAGTGLSYKLTKELLPALQTVADFLVDGLKDKSAGLNQLIEGVVFLTKVFLGVGETIFAVLDQIGLFVGNSLAYFIELGTGIYNAMARAAHFDWGGMVAAFQYSRTRMKGIDEQLANDSQKIWEDNAKFINGVFGPLAPASKHGPNTTNVNTKPQDKSDIVTDTIAKLQAQKDHESALAASIGTVTSENILATAAADANLKIAELEIAARKHNRTVTDEQKQSIIDLTIATAGYKAIVEDDKAFASFFTKTETQTASVLALADAYATANPEIIRNAEAMAIVAPLQEKIKELQELIANFHGPKEDLNVFINDLAKLKKTFEEAKILATGDKQKEGLFSAAKIVTASQPFGGTQQRIKDLELLRDREQQLGNDTSAFDFVIYQEKIKHVEEYMQYVFQAQNAEILGNAKLFDSQNSLIHQWDEVAFKVGNFGEKFQGVMNELVLQGRQAGAEVAKAFLTAIDGAETALAKLLTGQKANFKQVAENLAESIVKAGIQKEVGNIAGALGLKIGNKPDGTSSNPLHVILASGIPGLGGSSGGTSGGIGDLIGSVFGKVGGWLKGLFGGGGGGPLPFTVGGAPSALPDVIGAIASTGASGLGSVLGNMFGGFMANGGDVSPGKAYIVGEKHPEILIPGSRGRVVPGLPSSSDRPHREIRVTNNFNGFKDTDMMRKSQSQVAREVHRQMSIANARSH